MVELQVPKVLSFEETGTFFSFLSGRLDFILQESWQTALPEELS